TTGAVLRIRLSRGDGGQYARLNVGGVATLDGTLAASYAYMPPSSDVFTLLTFGSVQGVFAHFTQPSPGASLDYLAGAVRMLHPVPVTFHVFFTSSGPVGNGALVQ